MAETEPTSPILITGASGQYGTLVIAGLLAKGLAPSSLILLTRNPEHLAAYAAQGIVVRQGSFDDPVSQLAAAFAGARTMLLISTSRAGARLPQHQTAVDAAVKAGVRHIVYTSIVSAGVENPTALVAKEHRATEEMLRKSGLYWTALRDAQYAEAMTDVVAPGMIATGVMQINAGEGKMAYVSRDDCARSAVAVLAAPTAHRNKVYDITGPELLTWSEAAKMIAAELGISVTCKLLTDEEQLAIFDEMGIPRESVDDVVVKGNPWNSTDMVSFAKATRLGEMSDFSDDVQKLTGQKATYFAEICKTRLAKLKPVRKQDV